MVLQVETPNNSLPSVPRGHLTRRPYKRKMISRYPPTRVHVVPQKHCYCQGQPGQHVKTSLTAVTGWCWRLPFGGRVLCKRTQTFHGHVFDGRNRPEPLQDLPGGTGSLRTGGCYEAKSLVLFAWPEGAPCIFVPKVKHGISSSFR